ncbi:PREDICTED: kelch-like protein 42 [Dipodomys ordii]|uniref:Kelch-like protein 42 n=1 Tax=Dipodomys ordii TaxID=10020 RepID=A0A1S3GJ96_DIPOR|nr:PREDICTED: kelch-like protein 42 [Dipodomys ordii]
MAEEQRVQKSPSWAQLVTPLLQRLLSHVRLSNCLELYRLALVYGLPDLRDACLAFMAVHFHQVLCQPQFPLLAPPAPAPGDVGLKQQLLEARMAGTPVLVALGDFLGGPLAPHPYQGEPPSMLRYEETTERWFPLASNLPPDLENVRGYGAAALHNYLFIVGGYRASSQEIAAAHSYNPGANEWLQVASMNQKRSNFKLVAVHSKLYAIGGQATSNVECYSPEQDAWNFVAPLPNPLAEFSACECKGKIYVIGGYTTRGLRPWTISDKLKMSRMACCGTVRGSRESGWDGCHGILFSQGIQSPFEGNLKSTGNMPLARVLPPLRPY